MSKPKCEIHRYRRRNLTKNKRKDPYIVFACLDCSHFIDAKLAIGNTARCYFCKEEFVIKPKHLEFSKIKCDNCIKHKEGTKKLKDNIDEFLDEILSDL